ncbi:MAG: PDZ domain-containing protein [Planctomycetes bacterium]|nr:PDZ domain-containing protein [Planctomycetota bacterium]
MTHSVLWAGLALLAPPLLLQDAPAPRVLTLDPPAEGSREAVLEAEPLEAPAPLADLRVLLAQPDLDRRMAAFEETLARLGDPVVRAEIEQLAQRSDELGWTARLLLRDARRPAASRRLPRGLGGLPRLQDLFDSQPWPGFPGSGSSSSSSSSVQVQQGPDGVRVEVHTSENGQNSVRVYEGESLEALKRENPELEEAMGGGLHLELQGSPFGGSLLDLDLFGGLGGRAPFGPGELPSMEDLQRQVEEQLRRVEERFGSGSWLGDPASEGAVLEDAETPDAESPDAGTPDAESLPEPPVRGRLRRLDDELGSLRRRAAALEEELRELTREEASRQGSGGGGVEPLRLGVRVLDEGGRMRVQTVEPGSRAASVGVQPGDLLLRINGQEVHTPEEVSRRLGQILRGEAGFIGLVVDVEDQAGKPQARSGC